MHTSGTHGVIDGPVHLSHGVVTARLQKGLPMRRPVAKMVFHVIFQYNVLTIDDTHNTWTNIYVKMIIIRLIGPRDEKIQNPEEIRSKGLRQR